MNEMQDLYQEIILDHNKRPIMPRGTIRCVEMKSKSSCRSLTTRLTT